MSEDCARWQDLVLVVLNLRPLLVSHYWAMSEWFNLYKCNHPTDCDIYIFILKVLQGESQQKTMFS